MGNQRVGIFPPKSEILFVLSLALIWCRNFQDRTIPVGGDTWSSFWRKELIIIRRRIRIKKYRVQGSRFRSNISETVRDIRVPFSLLGRCKSHATKRCNPRLCSCYRFWDIVVANINNFPILLDFTRANTYMPSNEFARHNKETSRSGLLPPVEYLRNSKRYLSFVFNLANRKSHATKRCNSRLCSCYRFWDIVVANINNFPILLEQTRIWRRTSSHAIIIIRIKKHRVQGSCFRSNISETVRDIRVSFWLWPTGRVTLPNGATHVSVVVIVSEIL